jgi:hypothetical protein
MVLIRPFSRCRAAPRARLNPAIESYRLIPLFRKVVGLTLCGSAHHRRLVDPCLRCGDAPSAALIPLLPLDILPTGSIEAADVAALKAGVRATETCQAAGDSSSDVTGCLPAKRVRLRWINGTCWPAAAPSPPQARVDLTNYLRPSCPSIQSFSASLIERQSAEA